MCLIVFSWSPQAQGSQAQWLEVRADGSLDYQEKRFDPASEKFDITQLRYKKGLVNK